MYKIQMKLSPLMTFVGELSSASAGDTWQSPSCPKIRDTIYLCKIKMVYPQNLTGTVYHAICGSVVYTAERYRAPQFL